MPEVIEAVLGAYRDTRTIVDGKRETFIDTLRRVGPDPFKAALYPEKEAA